MFGKTFDTLKTIVLLIVAFVIGFYSGVKWLQKGLLGALKQELAEHEEKERARSHAGDAFAYYGGRGSTPRYLTKQQRTPRIDEISFESRKDAVDVIDELGKVIDEYGFATISDYYTLCDHRSNFPDSKYGWTSTLGMYAKRSPYKETQHTIRMPTPKFLD